MVNPQAGRLVSEDVLITGAWSTVLSAREHTPGRRPGDQWAEETERPVKDYPLDLTWSSSSRRARPVTHRPCDPAAQPAAGF